MSWPPRSVLWILLGVGVLLLLLAGAQPVVVGVYTSGLSLRERNTLMDITVGIKNFLVEYSAFPRASASPSAGDLETETAGPLLDCLLGDKVWGNQKGMSFIIDQPVAKEGRRGLLLGQPMNRLVDWWGQTYRVIIDSNRDDRVANPDVRNTDPTIRRGAREQLPASIIVFSCGPDGIPYTADDLPSWREGPAIPRNFTSVWQRAPSIMAWLGLGLVVYSIWGLIATSGRTGGPY